MQQPPSEILKGLSPYQVEIRKDPGVLKHQIFPMWQLIEGKVVMNKKCQIMIPCKLQVAKHASFLSPRNNLVG